MKHLTLLLLVLAQFHAAPQMPGMAPMNQIIPQMGNPWPLGSAGNPVVAGPPRPFGSAVNPYTGLPPSGYRATMPSSGFVPDGDVGGDDD